MPTVSEAFKTYHDFASADLSDIYGKRLESAKKLMLNHVETGIFINDGSGKFTFKPLPAVAQLAPTFGVVSTHFDGDGKLDLVLAQNFYHPQRETGRMNGSLSLVLLGNGDGTFRPLPPDVSGVSLVGDARSAATVDLNGNNKPDMLITRNGYSPQIYINNAAGTSFKIRLKSKPLANRNGIGSRITIAFKDGTKESHDVLAGCGYLSQSTPEIFVSQTSSNPIIQATVYWQDGSVSEHVPPTMSPQGVEWEIKQ